MVYLYVKEDGDEKALEDVPIDSVETIFVKGQDFRISRMGQKYCHPTNYTVYYGQSCPVTSRSYNIYRLNMLRYRDIDLDEFVKNNLKKRWMEIGCGFAGLIPCLAPQQKSAGGPRPLIIEPLNIGIAGEALEKVIQLEPDAVINGGLVSNSEMISRIRMLSDPKYVEHYCAKLEDLTSQQLAEFQNQFVMVVDYCASELYVPGDYKLDYEKFLVPGGRVVVSGFCHNEADIRIFDRMDRESSHPTCLQIS
jgi:hypothetical protein